MSKAETPLGNKRHESLRDKVARLESELSSVRADNEHQARELAGKAELESRLETVRADLREANRNLRKAQDEVEIRKHAEEILALTVQLVKEQVLTAMAQTVAQRAAIVKPPPTASEAALISNLDGG